jgi:HEAT repeat protein
MDRASLKCFLLGLMLALSSLVLGEPSAPQLRKHAWAVLETGLTHKAAEHRVEAVKALSLVTGDKAATKAAVHALSDENSDVRAAAATTLGQLHAVSAIPDLKEALSDKETSVVLAASQALFQLRDSSAYDVYYAILMGDRKASDGMIQSQLDRLKDPKKLALLGFEQGVGFVPYGGIGVQAYRFAKSDHSQPRAAAARFLALDPDPMSRNALVQIALTDDSTAVRQAALDALAERGDATCVRRLERNLTDSKFAVRYRTAGAMVHLSGVAARAKHKSKSQPLKSE